MHLQDMAIMKGLVSVAWADGNFADEETEIIEAFLDSFGASKGEAEMVREYAKEQRGLDDIDLNELSPDYRRQLLSHAVLVTYIDGTQAESERTFLIDLAAKLEIPAEERDGLLVAAEGHAKKFLTLL
jgi:uncharacterized tellurite resistance protein B-like protein